MTQPVINRKEAEKRYAKFHAAVKKLRDKLEIADIVVVSTTPYLDSLGVVQSIQTTFTFGDLFVSEQLASFAADKLKKDAFQALISLIPPKENND